MRYDPEEEAIIFSKRDRRLAGVPKRVLFNEEIFSEALDARDAVVESCEQTWQEFLDLVAAVQQEEEEQLPTMPVRDLERIIRVAGHATHLFELQRDLENLLAPQIVEEEFASGVPPMPPRR